MSGNLVIGTGVMAVAGTLPSISADLGVSVPAVGQLITAGAVLMCLAAPLAAGVVAGWDRRRLLAASLLWYAMLHAASALMPSFGALLPTRVLAMLAPAIFTPQAAACVGLLLPPEQRGRGITFVFMGWSVASVLGMPLAAWLGGHYGWRAAFWLVAVSSVAVAVWVWRTMPNGIRPAALSRSAWANTLSSPAIMGCIAVTALYSGGQFVLFSYFAPYYTQVLQLNATQLSLLFMWFGAFGWLGNWWMARHIDRIGAPRSVAMAIMAIALSLLLWAASEWGLWAAALVMVPWALGCFAANSAQQARLVGLAPALAPGSIALNTSAMYLGQGLGAATGGALIAQGLLLHLHWVGLAVMLVALAGSALATRAARRLAT